MEDKHAKTPWNIVERLGCWEIRNADGCICAMTRPNHYVGQHAQYDRETRQFKANFRLMVAAPDLLAACELLYKRMAEDEPLSTDLTYMRMAAAAIAKAKE